MSAYEQLPGKVLEAGERFEHVMALATNPTDRREGIVRCITSRTGDVAVRGFTDRSKLYAVSGTSLERFVIGKPLVIANTDTVVSQLNTPPLDYLGLEDPDIWIDEVGTMHLYFTMPFISNNKTEHHSRIHLGHAAGKDLDSLVMTMPVLLAPADDYTNSRAKEVSIAPLNSRGFRYNLFEGHDKSTDEDNTYSTVRVAKAQDMGGPWEFGPVVFHPAEHNLPWIGGHASPGPLLPRSFLDIGPGKLVGLINGREANKKEGRKILYGTFSIGLFIYDYENGKIDWVSPEPLIRDTEARTITFASDFIETAPGEGMLYAHVDDSFVRAYTLFADSIRKLLS
jgi:hypothetical protein